ncbi:MAG TPA: hypothetical protein VLX92_04335 [Kofleriaceae bacterium]|nr:hypothetical protein [Kofleriaceae bacterium]
MATHPFDPEQHKLLERTAVTATLTWSGWGSPVGLSILLVATGLFLVCLHLAGLVH